jgi:hypothetical protein
MEFAKYVVFDNFGTEVFSFCNLEVEERTYIVHLDVRRGKEEKVPRFFVEVRNVLQQNAKRQTAKS